MSRLCAPSLLVLATALAACTGADRRDTAGTTGGTLVIATPTDLDNLLPPVSSSQLAVHSGQLLFSRLAELTPALDILSDSGYTPVLARSWERRDPLTLVFHLDPRARWQDGEPLTAEDVAFTFEVYRDTLTASPFRVNLEPLESVTAEDAHTVVVRFRRAYPSQLYDATFHMQIVPRHLLDTIPRERLAASAYARDPVGAGPYRFERYASGAELELVADTTWFLGRPNLDRVLWRIFPDASAAVNAVLAGEADALELVPTAEEIGRVQGSADLRLVPYASAFLGGLQFNLRRPPFTDRELRRALARSLDRTTMVAAVFGEWGEVPAGFVTRMMWIGDAAIPGPAYDTSLAARTLDSLGWRAPAGRTIRERGGRPLRFTLITPTTSRIRQQLAVLVQDQLRKVGIEVRIQPLEFSEFSRRLETGAYEAALFTRVVDPNPAGLAQTWSSAAIGADNQTGYADPVFDSLLAAAAAAPARAEAERLYVAALARLNSEAPAVFLYAPRNNAVIHRRFADVTIRPDVWTATVPAWRVPPDQRLPRDR